MSGRVFPTVCLRKEIRMGGCCLVVLAMLIGPRLFLVAVWLLTNWYAAFDSRLVAHAWLAVSALHVDGVDVHLLPQRRPASQGGYLVLLILAVLLDIGVFSSGRRAMKK